MEALFPILGIWIFFEFLYRLVKRESKDRDEDAWTDEEV